MEKIQEVASGGDSKDFKWIRFKRFQVDQIQEVLSGENPRGRKYQV